MSPAVKQIDERASADLVAVARRRKFMAGYERLLERGLDEPLWMLLTLKVSPDERFIASRYWDYGAWAAGRMAPSRSS